MSAVVETRNPQAGESPETQEELQRPLATLNALRVLHGERRLLFSGPVQLSLSFKAPV